MNAHRLAFVAVVSAGVAVAIGAMASGETSVAIVGLVGVAALALGVMVGLPVVVIGGVLGLVVSYVVSVLVQDIAGIGAEALVVAPLIWLSFEASMRSFDLRPDVRSERTVTLEWAMWVVGIGGATVGSWVLVALALDAGPTGGVGLLAGALVVVVSVAGVLALVSVGVLRRAGTDALGAGSPGPGRRSD